MEELAGSEKFKQVVQGAFGHFPVGTQTEFEGSTISLPIQVLMKNGWISTEYIDFKAFMRLSLERRVRSQANRTQFEFMIEVWELHGRSEILSERLGTNAFITFSLTPPPQKQPKSICFSNQEGSDFPATIIYNACYDVFINERKIVDAQMGVAICTPIMGIPPRNVLVAFEKPFEDREFGIAFGRGCCWGMRTIYEKEFLEGVNIARKIRKLKAAKDAMGPLFST